MRSIASSFEFSLPTASPKNITVTALGFVAVIMAAAALYPKARVAPAAMTAPTFACATIDWRVGEKLAALQDRTDARSLAIVNSMGQQRAVAAAHCRSGRIDDAMALYSVTDRALTRYVSYGTGAALPQ
jgi:hypothetical protein